MDKQQDQLRDDYDGSIAIERVGDHSITITFHCGDEAEADAFYTALQEQLVDEGQATIVVRREGSAQTLQ